jgi:hypothetical protein
VIARIAVAVAVFASVPHLAVADELHKSAAAERHTSITLEPIFLVIPMIDASLEIQPTPHVGIALDAGYGHMMLPIGNSLWDIGGQGNIYLTRPFDGPHLGVELRWMGGGASIPFAKGPDSMSDVRERIAGIYAGYKWVGWKGLTAIVQFGIGHLDEHSTSDPPQSKLIPVGNLTAGYSF